MNTERACEAGAIQGLGLVVKDINARSHNPIALPQGCSGFVVSITLQVPEM